MKLFLLLLLNLAYSCTGDAEFTENNVDTRRRYNEFRAKYPRKNLTLEEDELRFRVFQETLKQIELYNAEHNTTTYGITKFADWTENERAALLNHFPTRRERSSYESSKWTPYLLYDSNIPRDFSWEPYGRSSRVRDQLHERNTGCNSCWAHTVSSAVEILWAIKYGKKVDICDDELIDCDFLNKGCAGGGVKRAFLRGYKFGYLTKQICDVMGSGCISHWNVQLRTLFEIPPNATAIAHFIANRGPVAVSIIWSSDMFMYSGYDIKLAKDCIKYHKDLPDHAVLIVGYGEEKGVKYWIIKNSYGKDWGHGGYFRLERGVNACLVESYPSSAEVA